MVQRTVGSGEDKASLFWIPVRIPGGTRQATRAEMAALFADQSAITVTQPGQWNFEAPHMPSGKDGLPGGQVTTADVEALLALDKHPALQAIAGHYLDKNWRQAQVADQIERSRAADFLDNLDSNEVSRRVGEAERVSGFHEDELELQECPVCGHSTLMATGPDDFGYGTTPGTCVVCSYHRSDDAAYEKNLDQEWRARWE